MDQITHELPAAVDAARRPSPMRSGPSPSVADFDPRQQPELARMITKLFALFPPQPDVEMRLEAYTEELAAIPWRWVSRALARLTEEPGRVFCPAISEIKSVIARLIHGERRRTDPRYNASQVSGGDEGQIRYLLDVVANELERGILPPGVTAAQAKAIAPKAEDGWDDFEPLL